MSFGSDYRINRRAALGTLNAVVLPGAFSVQVHAASRAATWPSWRGPTANGVADGVSLPTRWSRTSNVRWSVEPPGWGPVEESGENDHEQPRGVDCAARLDCALLVQGQLFAEK